MATRPAPTVPSAAVLELAFLDEPCEINQELDWLFEQNERRFEGGHAVWDELWRFDWETPLPARRGGLGGLWTSDPVVPRDIVPRPRRSRGNKDEWFDFSALMPGEHYARRQESSVYVNLMDAFATDIVGTLYEQAPAPDAGLDFGTCGKIRRKEDIRRPTEAELIYYNTDGVGVDGSQWDAFWSTQLKLAMVTGVRWIMVEAPSEFPRTQGRVRRGFRPYLVPFSRRQVINFHYDRGVLQWAIVKIATRKPKVVNGRFTGNVPQNETLVLVRRGNTDLGDIYSGGGWWRYGADKQLITDGTPSGTWQKTDGEIPMAPLFYDRHPRMFGRPALTELGNIAIAMMNLHSAADYDAFDAATSVKALPGVDRKGYNLFIEKVNGGNRYAPLPTNEETGKTPSLADASQGQTAADVFEKRILALFRAAEKIKSSEVNSAPQASGLAMQANFAQGGVPRLRLVAGNIESCQNAVITWIEQRFGHAETSGSVRWPKKFELVKLTSSAQAVLQLMQIVGAWSEELTSRVILAAAQDEGFVPDSAAATAIEAEIRKGVQDVIAQAKAKTQPPQTPGARSTPTPPEPAQTHDPLKTQIDGPNVE